MKGKLTSDGQQFHQYQQNEQSPLTLNCKEDNDIWSYKSRFQTGIKMWQGYTS